jgi:signal transduction histidine kinase
MSPFAAARGSGAALRRLFAAIACSLAFLSVFALPATPPARADAAVRDRIIELRDGTKRIDVARIALVYDERKPDEAPGTLGFIPDPALFRPIRWPADLNRGFTDTAVWLCFTIRSAASDRSWLIAAGPNYTDSVTAYIIDPDGRAETQTAGAAESAGGQGHAVSDFLFRLTIGPGEVKTVYLRFASQETLRIHASIWDAYRFIRADATDTAFVGLILGVVIAVFVYTMFLVISLREISYGFYLLYLVGLFFYLLAANGAGAWFLWPGNLWFERRATPFFACVMMFGIFLFGRAYMETRKNAPLFDKILILHVLLIPLFLFGLAAFDYRSAMKVGGFLLFSGLASMLVAGIRCAYSHERRAYYFTAAWIFGMAGAVTSQLGTLGFTGVYSDFFWAKGEQLGALIQVLILAYGISDTVNSMRLEKEEGQRRSIELLKRANAVKEDFLVATSLEFRSPLFGIIGLLGRLDTLIAERAGPEVRRLVSLVQAEALRLLNNVSTIATYSQLRHGDIALRIERFSLKEAIDGATAVSAYLAAGKDIAMERSIDDIEMLSDIRAVQQVIYNLYSDALKRCGSGRVYLEGRTDADGVRIAVVESGPPLSHEVLARGTGEIGIAGLETVGPGLELLVTRLLVERLGGGLSYDRREGENRFLVRLPLRAAWPYDQRESGRRTLPLPMAARTDLGGATAMAPADVDLSETKDDGKRKGRVLLADEDPVFLEALKHYLEERGYSVLPMLSCDRAAELARGEADFDLVLLDASGPSRSGLRACERIRDMRPLGELPVVIMTERESPESVAEAFRAGASDYMPKLAPTELLFARVDTQVALKRAVQEVLGTRHRIAELEKLKTLGVLAAGVAHEINTPNNAVLRNLPIMAEVWTELTPIVRRIMEESGGFSIRGWSSAELLQNLPELVNDTYAAGQQIKKIVEDLKDYARDSSSSPPEDVDLSAVAAYASRLLGPLVERRTLHFKLDAARNLPPVRASYQKLTQVAVNVLENALQALDDPNESVTVRIFADPDRAAVILECSDEGRGIEPDIRDRLFEPFFTTKRDSGGSGLGLPVALGIVRESGGDIEIDSTPGKGTTVRVVFPAGAPEEERKE